MLFRKLLIAIFTISFYKTLGAEISRLLEALVGPLLLMLTIPTTATTFQFGSRREPSNDGFIIWQFGFHAPPPCSRFSLRRGSVCEQRLLQLHFWRSLVMLALAAASSRLDLRAS